MDPISLTAIAAAWGVYLTTQLGFALSAYYLLGRPELRGALNLLLARFAERAGVRTVAVGRYRRDLPRFDHPTQTEIDAARAALPSWMQQLAVGLTPSSWIIRGQVTARWDFLVCIAFALATSVTATVKALYDMQRDLLNLGNPLLFQADPVSTTTVAGWLTQIASIVHDLYWVSRAVLLLADHFGPTDPMNAADIATANKVVQGAPPAPAQPPAELKAAAVELGGSSAVSASGDAEGMPAWFVPGVLGMLLLKLLVRR